MGHFRSQGNELIWEYNSECLTITPWGNNSCRVRATVLNEIEDYRYALLEPAETDSLVDIQEDSASITIGGLRVVAIEDQWSHQCRLKFYNADNELILSDLDRRGALAWKARDFQAIKGGNYKLTASFESIAEEKLFGMGQYQQGMYNLKGSLLELEHRNSQASVPFYVSSLGYGFLWHNPSIGQVSFANNKTVWTAESTRQLDYWVTVASNPAEIVRAYADASGKVPEMPDYGLGFWQCKLRYWNQEQLLDVAREYKRRNVPLDLIVCDFFHWPYMGDFRFEKEFYPDPLVMVDELKKMDIELMVSVWPQIDLRSENFDEMKAKGLLIKAERGEQISMRFGGDSLFFDATNSKARDYVWSKCKENYFKLGIRTFWLDEAEPEFGVYDYDHFRYKMGSALEIGNIYPQLYSRLFYEGMSQEGISDVVNLVRCAWAGSQRYGALVWSGDIASTFEAFEHQVIAGLHMGLAGIPWWTTDIGGFSGGDPEDPAFRELLVRWFQYGTFSPVMRLHGDRKPYTPLYYQDGRPYLHTGGENEIWSFGDEAYQILKEHICLRERMKPYTRQLMTAAHEYGDPILRTMFYEFPEDENCWSISDQYMFGSDLLVAPILKFGQRRRSVYLPGDLNWVNIFDGKTYPGGATVDIDAPIEYSPVFVRENTATFSLGILTDRNNNDSWADEVNPQG